ncbi:hypothetical protein PHYSODRAFT_521043 [Phytophthora sojae]|uniref:Uncharacterized protein n=1 Tax=Phytophthora sojae (strain P6497) TaxID=1094619 RepID=G4ZZU3_PHYSP|nr:hypothetical protein PHYSODRAFT_521043 [Phytophthora sojae]EGZ11240.1 hypothetical protein PHYSODRAFT_521043 [Phytophthora sojae]|eukprot:XP_009533985.1 hypothetical protein PHYSODRAFT_521043 [Phytophthora sojae]
MADLAISVDEFNAAGCEALTCADSNGGTAQTYKACRQSPVDVLAASKCVVEVFESDSSSNGIVWSTGGNSTTLPDIRVVKNSGVTSCGCSYTVYSIHTASPLEQSSIESGCPADPRSASLVIPCYGNDTVPDALRDRITTPKGSDWVIQWILEHGGFDPTTESSRAPSQGSASATTEAGGGGGGGLSWWWLLIIVLLILLLIIATVVACRHCHRLSRFTSPPDNTTYIFVGGRMWAVEDDTHGRGAGYWLRFANWCRKTFNFFN